MNEQPSNSDDQFNWVLVSVCPEECADHVRIVLPLPGFDEERSRVIVGDDHVCLELFTPELADHAPYRRTVPVKTLLDPDAVHCHFDDGRLVVTVDKKKEALPGVVFLSR